MFVIVIDKETKFVIEECVIVNDYEPKENEEVMPYDYDLGNPVCNMNKPQYIDGQWIDTDPLPPQEEVTKEPTEVEILTNKISNLESENKLLNAQIQATISNQEFLENCLIEMAMTVYA